MIAPEIGARFTATWGSRYAVHRIDGDRVVLRDLDRPSACVIPTLAELAASGKYLADTAAEIAPTSAPAAPPQAALLLVDLAPAATGGRGGDRRSGAKPAAPRATPAPSSSACSVCGRGGHGVALAVLEIGGTEIAYCWRCYGVEESRGYGVTGQREAAAAAPVVAPAAATSGPLHTDWRPPPGEVCESRADVGSFDPPRPEDRRPPAPRPKPAPPPRVDAQTWLAVTGEVTR